MPEHQYALLIANGLSIAYNADLSVAALTAALSDEFQRAGGDDAIGTTADSLQAMHQRGLATTLATIDARARDQDARFDAVINSVCALMSHSGANMQRRPAGRPSSGARWWR